ncbi:Rrf2 family transcriptional regulator [Rubellicoccus peritrichatus]|uniref:Rrf2 family transcriptional regulator n=1 Tax=Rubellicoccus peritrichatus TaxID=3080537 RepID=A0AAQ3L5L9_9BACT|nr:Rrf2 family transcriptional regulator [Puniceicoccus sp. CR14]WOO39869.1 Rrf2 family transcriptional regulator [Puniceicoccus sp. CR14]
MKLSLKVEYACRVLAQLGRRFGTETLAHIDELAEAEAVPANYLVQILNELRNGSLITSKRGKQGGYALANSPEEITLRDIVAVVDSEMLEAEAGKLGQSGPLVADAWASVSDALDKALKGITLKDMMPDDSGNMYYI